MKHVIGGMDATKELIFKAFMWSFKAFGVVLWHFKVVQMILRAAMGIRRPEHRGSQWRQHENFPTLSTPSRPRASPQ
jgi:hypothetical protein